MKLQAVALVLAVVAFDAMACSCTFTPLSEKIEDASFVAVVRVESTRVRPNLLEFLRKEEMERESWLAILADFTPVTVLKGDASKVTALATGFGGGDCGISLVPGLDYLVLGDQVAGELDVGLCTGSESLGPHSLVASLPNADRWTRPNPLLDAVQRQVEEGVPVPECLDNNPRLRFSPHRPKCEAPDSDANASDHHP